LVIDKIYLKNYRNYSEQTLLPEEGINILYGKNAQGKTNIIESVFLCSSGRSHRTAKDIYLIREGESRYEIRIEGRKADIPFSITLSYDRGNKKTVKVNNISVQRIGELMGVLNTVIFSPEDLKMIKEGPSERRKSLDILISQVKPSYFYLLQDYQRYLKQKNALLKKKEIDENLLGVYNEKLAARGSAIIRERLVFICNLEKSMQVCHNVLTNCKEAISIRYVSSMGEKAYSEDYYLKRLEREKASEMKNMMSINGPHRDDMEIMVNNYDIKDYGSQGQQRTAILSLKLAEIEIIKSTTGFKPILLLDDVMSELDAARRKYLLNSINARQVFITSTEKKSYALLKDNCTYFHVVSGNTEKKM
jgi:DNA replication and repair protein RecF